MLVERGLAASRSQAVRLIAGGLRWRDAGSGADWRSVGKNRDDIPESAELELVDAAESRYVSRGGLKLDGALAATGVDPAGRRCLDIGQSTGGFTDCLLQHGAVHVVGIDVGHGQLHDRIRADERVTAIEKVNARALTAGDFPEDEDTAFDLIVGDLSFISLALVLEPLIGVTVDDGDLALMVKPQFEVGKERLGKGGVVRDPALRAEAGAAVAERAAALGWGARAVARSPLPGPSGNVEFFLWLRRGPATIGVDDIHTAVQS